MSWNDLDQRERLVVKECLHAAAEGPFFPDWEFQTLFGLVRAELRRVLDSWQALDDKDVSVRLAINNTLNNLLYYPGCHKQEEWTKFISVTDVEVSNIYFKWKGSRPRDYLNGME